MIPDPITPDPTSGTARWRACMRGLPWRSKPVVWRRFRARRGSEASEVTGVIVSATGQSYPDPAWWWWQVNAPGSRDSGPWWVITRQKAIPKRMGERENG